jgi:hypothetical protein
MGKSFAERKAEAQDAVETMHAKLVADVESGADWMAHLKFIRSLHAYSPRNAALLWVQWEDRKMARHIARVLEVAFYGTPVSPELPELSHCAGGQSWIDRGGMMNKGEKGLSVLAPVIINDKDDIDPVTKKPRKKVIGFTLKSRTFDISQVSGVEAPPALTKPLTGEGPEGAWDALVRLAESEGYRVEVKPVKGKAHGVCYYDQKLIVVETTNDPAQQVKTLTHEIGHMLLHEPEIVPANMPRNVREIEAESVAYTVLSMLDFATDDYSLGYVGGWSKGDGALVASTVTRVVNTATRIIEFLETGELPKGKSNGRYEFAEEPLAEAEAA